MIRKVRLELWVIYDSSNGYVWPQVYEQKPDHDERINFPHKKMKLISGTYFSSLHSGSGSFGKEVRVKSRRKRIAKGDA